MHPAFQRLSSDFASRLQGITSAACGTHPGGDATDWTVQEIVEHLVLTYRGTVQQVGKYLALGRPTGKKPSAKESAARLLVVGLGVLPRGQKAPEFTVPGRSGMPAMDGPELALLLREELEQMDAQLKRCEQAFGTRRFAAHFRLGPMSVAQWRKFHCVHGRLHLDQLKRVAIAARS